jgi:hypothetical protein
MRSEILKSKRPIFEVFLECGLAISPPKFLEFCQRAFPPEFLKKT